jgi:hypothetical protein
MAPAASSGAKKQKKKWSKGKGKLSLSQFRRRKWDVKEGITTFGFNVEAGRT